MAMKMKMAAEIKRRNQEPCEAMPRAPYLTQHLIVEILSKLPVKALLRFKCVSKRWRSLISDPHFIKAHLNQSLTTNSNIQTQRILVATPFCPLRVYTVSFGGSSDNDDDDIDVAYGVISKGAQLNGAIHWVCLEGSDDKPSEIAVFRLEDEKLWTIPLPAAASITSFNDAVELGVFDGCLCIVACGGDNAFCWAMREYGVNQYWAKLHIKLPYYFHMLQPLTTLRRRNDEEEDTCLIDFEKFVLYNTRGNF
ncbi:F-box/kelch-repeat protein At3g06240-like [Cornus florida]|uniref:F-box/kelch-repeat protein At3g06240-like n=1 Tax=Cornus florida TaxID=4283 RepID=UPI00289A89F2|nr:F-box/kelch-repeat protein At3g06240-like [Cornus florida]